MVKSIQLKTGQKFNRLTVIKLDHTIEYLHKKSGKKTNQEIYMCLCSCGNTVNVNKNDLRTEHTKSCGCFRKDVSRALNTKHGLLNHRLHKTWSNIKGRCSNKRNSHYRYYGGRGITICDEWRNDFKTFYDWAMVNNYKKGLSIDRIDNNRNYEPSNCRWATNKEQQRNKNSNKLLTYNGITKCLSEWAEEFNIKKGTLKARICMLHWSTKKAFEKPVRPICLK